jgi:hypothetical protein
VPKNCSNAGPKSDEDSPWRYSSGNTSATRGDFRDHAGRIAEANRRRSPFTGSVPLVVDPRLRYLHRPRGRRHLPRLMEAVPHHQPATLNVHLATMSIYIRGDLGPQRRRQHLPGTIADNLIQHQRAGLVGPHTFLDYLEHQGVPSRTSEPTPVLIRTAMDFRSSSRRCARSRHPPRTIHRF